MTIVAKVGDALQRVFGEIAELADKASKVVRRKRKFTALTLAKTFVLGFLQNPKATNEDLAQVAAQCGVQVTAQAIDQRHTAALVEFLEAVFREVIQVVVGDNRSFATILERFSSVIVLDSTTITLPGDMKDRFPGCGGRYGGGEAALKLQTELDLRCGALSHVEIEPGRSPDNASSRKDSRHGPGSLRIADLGYFDVAVFGEMTSAGEYFLSRLHFGTIVGLLDDPDAELSAVALMSWLSEQEPGFIDQPIWLSKEYRLSCRLIAWRLPEEQANRRRQKLRKDTLRKHGQEPSAARLAWCDWTVLITNVPVEILTPKEVTILYRARWQVELLFKRWKSQDIIAVLSGSTSVHQMVRFWSRLIAAVIQHWLLVGSVWGDPTKSWSKVCEAVRKFVGRIIIALPCRLALEGVLMDLRHMVEKTCRRNKRTKPGTFELLNNVQLLDFGLT